MDGDCQSEIGVWGSGNRKKPQAVGRCYATKACGYQNYSNRGMNYVYSFVNLAFPFTVPIRIEPPPWPIRPRMRRSEIPP
jgi:hypothetical protein